MKIKILPRQMCLLTCFMLPLMVSDSFAQKKGGGSGGGGGLFGGGNNGSNGNGGGGLFGGGNQSGQKNWNNNSGNNKNQKSDDDDRPQKNQWWQNGKNNNNGNNNNSANNGNSKSNKSNGENGSKSNSPFKGWNIGENSRLKGMDKFENKSEALAKKYGDDSPRFYKELQKAINNDQQMRRAFLDLGGSMKELSNEARQAAREQRNNRGDYVGGSRYVQGQTSHPDNLAIVNNDFDPPFDMTPQKSETGENGQPIAPTVDEPLPNTFEILLPAAEPRTNNDWDLAVESTIVDAFRSLKNETAPAMLLTDQDVGFLRDVLKQRKSSKSLEQDFELQLSTVTHTQLNSSYFRQKGLEVGLSKNDIDLFLDRAKFSVKLDELRQQLLWAPSSVVSKTLDELRAEYDRLSNQESLPQLRGYDGIKGKLLELAEIRDDLKASKEPQEYSATANSMLKIIEVPGATNRRPRAIKRGVAIAKSEENKFRIKSTTARSLVSFSSSLIPSEAKPESENRPNVSLYFTVGSGTMPVTVDGNVMNIESGNFVDMNKTDVTISFPTGNDKTPVMEQTLSFGDWEFYYSDPTGWRVRPKAVAPVVIINEGNAKRFHFVVNGQARSLKPGEVFPIPITSLNVTFRQTDDASGPAVTRYLTSGRYYVGIIDGETKIDLFRDPG